MNQGAATVAVATGRQPGSLLSIQVLRALAALAVVMPHITREFELKFGLPDVLPLDAFRLGNAGVDVFFVISGFIMVHVSEHLFGRRDAPLYFFLRRCARIVPLYWAVSMLLLAHVLLQYGDLRPANLSIESVVASFLFFPYPKLDGEISPINGIGWTLNYEMFFYVVFAVALLVSRRAAVIGISVLFLGLVAANLAFGPFANPFAFWSDPIIIEFLFGMWIALAFRAGLRVPGWMSCGLVMAGVAVMVGSFFWGFGNFPRLAEWGVPAALVVGGIILSRAPQSTAIGWRMLGFLGDASYALYLIHPVALTLPRLVIRDLVFPATHPWLYVVLLYLTVVAAALVVHLLFEKPMTRLLQQRIAAVRGWHKAGAESRARVYRPSG